MPQSHFLGRPILTQKKPKRFICIRLYAINLATQDWSELGHSFPKPSTYQTNHYSTNLQYNEWVRKENNQHNFNYLNVFEMVL